MLFHNSDGQTCADPIPQHIFPLLYLLLKRHARILRLAGQVRIDDQEFGDAQKSLWTVIEALHSRLEVLICER